MTVAILSLVLEKISFMIVALYRWEIVPGQVSMAFRTVLAQGVTEYKSKLALNESTSNKQNLQLT
jgi:hypothetical protein